MPISLSQCYALGIDPIFIQRVGIALLAQAYIVETEPPTTAMHVYRVTFASKIVANPDLYAAQMARLVAAVDSAAAGAAYIGNVPNPGPSQLNVTDAMIVADVAIGFSLMAGL